MRPQQDPNMRRARPAPLAVEVTDVSRPGGGFVRVRFGGPALKEFRWPGPASHLKFIPSAKLPEDLGTGRRPLSRTYTPRAYDEATGELVIDFLVHGDGPAAAWAKGATVGTRAMVTGARATWAADPSLDWLLLAGDDSAVPAIATIIEAGVPPTTTVIIETVSSESDRPPLPEYERVAFVQSDPAQPGGALLEAVRAFAKPAGAGSVWVAGEALAIRQIRRHLLTERNLHADAIVTRGYWRQGESNHPDHDFGVD